MQPQASTWSTLKWGLPERHGISSKLPRRHTKSVMVRGGWCSMGRVMGEDWEASSRDAVASREGFVAEKGEGGGAARGARRAARPGLEAEVEVKPPVVLLPPHAEPIVARRQAARRRHQALQPSISRTMAERRAARMLRPPLPRVCCFSERKSERARRLVESHWKWLLTLLARKMRKAGATENTKVVISP